LKSSIVMIFGVKLPETAGEDSFSFMPLILPCEDPYLRAVVT
jgi:hypothetical protein